MWLEGKKAWKPNTHRSTRLGSARPVRSLSGRSGSGPDFNKISAIFFGRRKPHDSSRMRDTGPAPWQPVLSHAFFPTDPRGLARYAVYNLSRYWQFHRKRAAAQFHDLSPSTDDVSKGVIHSVDKMFETRRYKLRWRTCRRQWFLWTFHWNMWQTSYSLGAT